MATYSAAERDRWPGGREGLPLQERPQLGQRTGVEHVTGLDPAAAGLVDSKAHGVETERRMGVGGNRELDAQLLGFPTVYVIEVEPARMGIAFEKAAALLGPPALVCRGRPHSRGAPREACRSDGREC